MVRWLEAQRLRRVATSSGVDTDRCAGKPARTAQGVHVGRPRRVLVGDAARQRRGRTRRRGEPRVLQRQRDLLEDALGASIDGTSTPRTARSCRYKETHAERQDRSDAGRGPARGATRASPLPRRRRHVPRTRSPGTIFMVNCVGPAATVTCRPSGRPALLAQHSAVARSRRYDATLAPGHARLRVERGPRQRVPPRRADRPVVDDRADAAACFTDHGSTYAPGPRRIHSPCTAPPSGALVFDAGTVQWSLGSRRHARPGRLDSRTPRCSRPR